MYKLDERDIQILSILQEEGGRKKKERGERRKGGRRQEGERRERREEEGGIEGYGAKLSSQFLKNFHLVITEVELESHKEGEFARFEDAIMGFDEVLSCWSVGGGLDYILKVLVKDVSDYQDFLKRVLKANIGLRRYFSYAVLDKIKDTDVVPDSLIRRSGVVK